MRSLAFDTIEITMPIALAELLRASPAVAGSDRPLDVLRARLADVRDQEALREILPSQYQSLCERYPAWTELVVARLIDAQHFRALAALCDHIALPWLVARSQLPIARHEEQSLVYEATVRLAACGAFDAALAMAQRSAWDGALYAALDALCSAASAVDRPKSAALLLARAREDSSSVGAKALCDAAAWITDSTMREQVLALARARIEALPNDHIDVGDNPWGWLAVAHARCAQFEAMARCIERARTAVRDRACDESSDVRAMLDCATALDALVTSDVRGRDEALEGLHQAAFDTLFAQQHPPRELVDALRARSPERHSLPTLIEEPLDESAMDDDPVASIEAHATESVASWGSYHAGAIRAALHAAPRTLRPRDEVSAVSSDPSRARALYARWMRASIDHASSGWIRAVDGAALDYEHQLALAPHLTLDEVDALLAHACPSPDRRESVLYLVERAARLRAARGELAAMRAHVATIAQVSTTPALEFSLALSLPEPLREAELSRLVATMDEPVGEGLTSARRTSAVLLGLLQARLYPRVVALIDGLRSPWLALECWGLAVRWAILDAIDHALVRSRIEAVVERCLSAAAATAVLTDTSAEALRQCDRGQVERLWRAVLRERERLPPWSVTALVLDPAALEAIAEELSALG